jgi:hypothetical protein
VAAPPLRYFLSDLTKQQIRQGLAVLPGIKLQGASPLNPATLTIMPELRSYDCQGLHLLGSTTSSVSYFVRCLLGSRERTQRAEKEATN